MKCLSDYNSKRLSSDEYNLILNFLYEYKLRAVQGDPIRQLLMSLTKYFSCYCASLWFVDSDLRMHNPIGYNLPPELLLNYENIYQQIDEYHVRHFLTNQDNPDISAIVYEFSDESRKPSPYYEDLKKAGITHRYSIVLKSDGEIRGAIGLFQLLNNMSDVPVHCLEALAPFISLEFENSSKTEDRKRNENIMLSILNTASVGITLFDNYPEGDIYYYNSACVSYFSDLIQEDSLPNNIINHFVESLVDRFGEDWKTQSECQFTLTSPTSNQVYNIRLVNRVDHVSMTSLFITPLKSITDTPYSNLFSQLTSREQQVTLCVARGLTNQEIADTLHVSLSTVKTHLAHIFEKASVSNRTSLMSMFFDKTDDL